MQVGIQWASACVQVSEHEHPARHVCPRIRVEKTPVLYSVCQELPHMLAIIVQWLRHVRLFVIPWTPGFPFLHHLPEFAQTHVCWLGDAIQPSHPLLSPFPPAFNLSGIRVFSSESALHIRWPKYWSFSFSISPSNEHSGLSTISFRMDWLDLLAVQGTLKSLLQHHSSKTSILLCSAFFIVQLSHPYMTTGKTITLIRQTFVGKVMSLLFNMLSAAAAAKSLQSCPALQPHRWQPIRLPGPWDSPGKNTGVGNMLSRLVITFLFKSKLFFNYSKN